MNQRGLPNFDEMTDDALTRWVTLDLRYRARETFPQRPRGYVNATRDLLRYALSKREAMRCRVRENPTGALEAERTCDRIYAMLPEYARFRPTTARRVPDVAQKSLTA